MKKYIMCLSLIGAYTPQAQAMFEAAAWQRITLPARIPYALVEALGSAVANNTIAQKMGLFFVGKAKLLDNRWMSYGEKTMVDDMNNRIFNIDGEVEYGQKQAIINTGVSPFRTIYHYFMTRHADNTKLWSYRLKEMALGVATAYLYHKIYTILKYWYYERTREIAFKKSVAEHLTDEKLEEIARLTDELSNGDLQGIINKIKTYASITDDGTVTQEIVDEAVREYVDKHQAFKKSHAH